MTFKRSHSKFIVRPPPLGVLRGSDICPIMAGKGKAAVFTTQGPLEDEEGLHGLGRGITEKDVSTPSFPEAD